MTTETAEGPAAKIMELLFERKEDLGDGAYVDLCNLTSLCARSERREKRLRDWIVKHGGAETCSALAPSDAGDDGGAAGSDQGSDQVSDFDDVLSNASGLSDLSSLSTCSATSASGVSVEEQPRLNSKEDLLYKTARLPSQNSGLFVRHMGRVYALPLHCIVRNYNEPIQLQSATVLTATVTRGQRSAYMTSRIASGEPNVVVPYSSIVVLKLMNRRGECDYFWTARFSVEGEASDDAQIVRFLPAKVVTELVEAMRNDPQMEHSCLFKMLPRFIEEDRSFYLYPIPGRDRRFEEGQAAGNYMLEVELSKRPKTLVVASPGAPGAPGLPPFDLSPSPVADSDDDDVVDDEIVPARRRGRPVVDVDTDVSDVSDDDVDDVDDEMLHRVSGRRRLRQRVP